MGGVATKAESSHADDSFKAVSEQDAFHFDPSKCSEEVTFGDNNRRVAFPAHSSNKVAYFNSILSKDGSNKKFGMRLKLLCDEEDFHVVVGFSKAIDNCENPQLLEGTGYYLFHITEKGISIEGKMVQLGVSLSRCYHEGEVECLVDLDTDLILYTVTNKIGSITQPLPMKIEGGFPNKFYPMVGLISNATKQKVILQLTNFNSSVQVSEPAVFDKESTFGPVIIKENGHQASRENVMSNCCALVNKVLDSGKHRWTFKVVCDIGASLCLGVVKHPFVIANDEYSDHLKHIYRHKNFMCWRSYRGFLYANGNQLPKTLEPLGWLQNRSVSVEFILDFHKGTLEIIKEGVPLGVAFEHITGPVQPAVAFYAGYEKAVELVSFKSEQLLVDNSNPLILAPGPSPISHQLVTFDKSTKFGSLAVSEKSLTRDKSDSGNAYCFLNVFCTTGVYRWSFVLECDQGASTCIGIATEPVSNVNEGNIYTCRSMYLYRSFKGMLYSKGRELSKRFAEFWPEGSLVEVVLDLDNGVLQYLVNGEYQGVAFANLEGGTYRPVVAFYASMDKKITLVYFENNSYMSQMGKSSSFCANNLEDSITLKDKEDDISSIAPEMRSDNCIVCGVKDSNVIALPCRHAVYCAAHINTDGSLKCVICDKPITGVWNLF